MICSLIAPDFPFPSLKPTFPRSPRRPPLYFPKHILCLHHRNPNIFENPSKPTGIFINTLVESNPGHVLYREAKKREGNGRKREFPLVGSYQMLLLCGLGYWVQGFRCFPWLALNFHMAHYLNLHPSILQLVQNSGNLPMVAKPLYGILSDALYIGGARRVPYVSIGGMLGFSLNFNHVLVHFISVFLVWSSFLHSLFFSFPVHPALDSLLRSV